MSLDKRPKVVEGLTDPEEKKGPVLFGRDLSQIPCFRSSFLYGILGGLGIGITNFLLTSRIKRSTDFAVYSFVGITATYYSVCRYQRSKQEYMLRQIKQGLERYVEVEGTELDPKIFMDNPSEDASLDKQHPVDM